MRNGIIALSSMVRNLHSSGEVKKEKREFILTRELAQYQRNTTENEGISRRERRGWGAEEEERLEAAFHVSSSRANAF